MDSRKGHLSMAKNDEIVRRPAVKGRSCPGCTRGWPEAGQFRLQDAGHVLHPVRNCKFLNETFFLPNDSIRWEKALEETHGIQFPTGAGY